MKKQDMRKENMSWEVKMWAPTRKSEKNATAAEWYLRAKKELNIIINLTYNIYI